MGVCGSVWYLIGAVCVGDSRERLQGRSDRVGQDEGSGRRTVLLRLRRDRQTDRLYIIITGVKPASSRGCRGSFISSYSLTTTGDKNVKFVLWVALEGVREKLRREGKKETRNHFKRKGITAVCVCVCVSSPCLTPDRTPAGGHTVPDSSGSSSPSEATCRSESVRTQRDVTSRPPCCFDKQERVDV